MKKTVISVMTATAVVLAGCANSESDDKHLTLGYMKSWSDMVLMAHLIDHFGSEHGYSFEHTEVNDVAAVYTAVANGDIDVVPSTWPERTNSDQYERYQDEIEDIGVFYPNARLTLAVPDYMTDINSIDDLIGQEDRFDGEIVGIEAGSGSARVMEEDVIPEYGLDDYDLLTSSTPAMIAELDDAIASNSDIVVTLWRPYWANQAYDVKDLEDPRGALGGNEGLHTLARSNFTEEHSDLAQWIADIDLSDEQYGALEDLILNKYDEGQEAEAVDEWLQEYGDTLPEWPSS